MKIADRVVGVLLLVGSAVTLFYWWSYFSGGDVMVLHDRWYTAFESSFPVADAWMALCMAIAGVGFIAPRRFAAPFGLMAGATLLYLVAMDITFDVENDMYAIAVANDAMKFEVFINITTFFLAMVTLVVSWSAISRQMAGRESIVRE
jgi:hypothetical protein